MTGWCPVHDKVYEADDGLCPRCGTALVAEEEAPSYEMVVGADEDVATEAPPAGPTSDSRRRAANVVTVVAAVVVAFVAGLAFPQPDKNAVERGTPSREARSDLNIGVTRIASGVAVRLESFTQRGPYVVARFTLPGGAQASLGRLRSATVSFFTPDGVIADEFQLPIRATLTGFIVEGTSRVGAETPIVGLRIERLSLAEQGPGTDTPIDLTRVWPATKTTEPRTRRSTGTFADGNGRTFAITGLVGWADRVEIGLRVDVPKSRSRWAFDTEFTLVSQAVEVPGTSLDGPTTSTVRFDGLPREARRWALRVSVRSVSVVGPWNWAFG